MQACKSAAAAPQRTGVVLELVEDDLAVGHHKSLHGVHLQGVRGEEGVVGPGRQQVWELAAACDHSQQQESKPPCN